MSPRLPVFVLFVQVLSGIACGGEPEPREQATIIATATGPLAVICGGAVEGSVENAPKIITKPGEPLTFHINAREQIDSCRCQYVVAAQWSCTEQRVCESRYDLGSDNPDVCNRVSEGEIAIDSVSVEQWDGCDGTSTNAPDRSVDLTMTCSLGHHWVFFDVATAGGHSVTGVGIDVTETGACPID